MVDFGRDPELARPEELVFDAIQVESFTVCLYVFGWDRSVGSTMAQLLVLVFASSFCFVISIATISMKPNPYCLHALHLHRSERGTNSELRTMG